MKKVLVIRFSSIGDIVLTSPVLRALKEQAGMEVHFLTKARYAGLLKDNSRIDRLYTFGESLKEVLPALKAERYDFILDLHNNLRSHRVRLHLRRPARAFRKCNWQKWLMVRFKWKSKAVPHVVFRYMEAGKALGLRYDGKGLEHFLASREMSLHGASGYGRLSFLSQGLSANGNRSVQAPLVVVAIGGTYATKRLPVEKLVDLCVQLPGRLVLLGGAEDRAVAGQIAEAFAERRSSSTSHLEVSQELGLINLCGETDLRASALVLAKADLVVAHDTGMMHLAAAFKKPLISIWGNTVPAFGMYPLYPEGLSSRHVAVEVKDLPCRPCSKLGFAKCPRGHFDCMMKQDVALVLREANRLLAENGHLSFISEKK